MPPEALKLNTPDPARSVPELLAPAGDWECVRAAVENGADAIYFGLSRFNARMRAQNFTEADLPALMEFLHRRGVRGYVTFNTLIFQNELAQAEDYLRTIIAGGADAVIVQDVGLCRLIRRLSPDFPIHASTQMTITSPAGVEFARELGCNLVVLARECSLVEIERVAKPGLPGENSIDQSSSAQRALPVEVFVHGALCVAYSGQCLTSESLGGRSANRGECAQACRLPYDLISDGRQVPLGDRKYLLSPQDLAGLELLPELVKAGVASLKIEGRLKSPEYVANITRLYRRALDECGPRPPGQSSPRAGQGEAATPRYDMEMAFSRGLYSGWLRGTNNRELVHARFGKKRGVYLGEVTRVLRDAVVLRLEAPLKPGDGVVFDAGKPEEEEQGGRVYEITTPKGDGQRTVELRFGRGDVDFNRIHAGDKVWKTDDPALNRQLRQTFSGEDPKFQRAVTFEIHGQSGQPLILLARDERGHAVQLESALPLTVAEKQPLTTGRLEEQLGRLGGTAFRLGSIRNELSGDLMLPLSELNRLRREAVAKLDALRALPVRWTLHESGHPQPFAAPAPSASGATFSEPELIVLVRAMDQLEAALRCGAQTIYCEFEDPKRYREAVRLVRESSSCAASGQHPPTADRPREIWVAPPRIFKPGEDWIINQVKSCGADGCLVRNHEHLRCFSEGVRRIGDYSLNVANRLTADYFLDRFGLERVTASYDLNFAQLEALLAAGPAARIEITIHQHIPMFHMEHCVFCAFLSNGKDYHDCGRPCEKHTVEVRDRVGARHPLKADAGCRNTVFHAMAQTGAEFVGRMLQLGVRSLRVEFLNETPDVVARTIGKYRQLLRGEISGAQVWRDLQLLNQLGVTRGQMATEDRQAREAALRLARQW